MRYLLINSLKSGGAERVAQILSNASLFDMVILLEKDQDFDISIPIEKITNFDYRTNVFIKTLWIPFSVFKLGKSIKAGDVVVSFSERANFTNILLKFYRKNKAVVTLHTNIVASFKNWKKFPYYLLIKGLYRYADAVVSVSSGIQADFNNMVSFAGIKRVIYNPIDFRHIKSGLIEDDSLLQNVSCSKSIVNVGRLAKPKAQWLLLEIFKDVLSKDSNCKLFIIGDGELRNYLVNYSRKIGLKTFSIFDTSNVLNGGYNVYFLGYQQNPYKIIKKSQLFVLTSQYEGFPMAIIEAMACGTPVLSADCKHGPREILYKGADKYGIILPPVDSDTKDVWVERIIEVVTSKKLRENYSALSLKRVGDFSIDITKGLWLDLFRKLS